VSTGLGSAPHRTAADWLWSLLGPGVSPVAVPTVYFDTQAVSWVESGTVDRNQWQIALGSLGRSAHHAVSLTTLYELLMGLAEGPQENFLRFRNRIGLLSMTPYTTFLPLSKEFLRTRLFGLPPSRPDFDPEVLKQWLPIIANARTRMEMETGQIDLGHPTATFGLNLELIRQQVSKGKAGYIRRLKKMGEETLSVMTHAAWASSMVAGLGLRLTPENQLAVKKALDAQYCHDVSMMTKARNGNFNYIKNSSAWLDAAQLVYLADPTFIFVTGDERLIKDAAQSEQARRIVSFRYFLSEVA
jgi:hypothetical protein